MHALWNKIATMRFDPLILFMCTENLNPKHPFNCAFGNKQIVVDFFQCFTYNIHLFM